MFALAPVASPASPCISARHAPPARRLGAQPRQRLRKPHADSKAGDDASTEPLSVSQVAEQLMRDPDNTARMQRVTEAAQRVAALQAESERLAAEMAAAQADSAASAEAAERRAQAEGAELIAAAEVKAAEKLLQAAQLQAAAADAAKSKWASDIQEDAERIESGKAAAAAAAAGALASLPIAAAGGGLLGGLLALGSAGVASALLGVTYRYAVRQDTGNLQLKAGVVAAFGLARGLGQAQGILASSGGDAVAGLDLSLDALGGAGLALGQCMLVAAFAATAVEAGMQRGLVQPFGAAGGGGERDGT